METGLMEWLAAFGWRAFTWSLAGLLLLNAAAAIGFILRGTRGTVHRWTAAWLAGNLLLLAIGVGVPTMTTLARLVVTGAQRAVPATVWFSAQTAAEGPRE